MPGMPVLGLGDSLAKFKERISILATYCTSLNGHESSRQPPSVPDFPFLSGTKNGGWTKYRLPYFYRLRRHRDALDVTQGPLVRFVGTTNFWRSERQTDGTTRDRALSRCKMRQGRIR
jgi:hypothetical protein